MPPAGVVDVGLEQTACNRRLYLRRHCHVFQESAKLNKIIEKDPAIAKEMLYSLSKEVFRMSKLRTPLLEQASPPPPSPPLPSPGCCLVLV